MINSIVPLMDKLRRVPFGSKLYQKLVVNYPEINKMISNKMNMGNFYSNPNPYLPRNNNMGINNNVGMNNQNPYMYYFNNQFNNMKK